MKLWLKGCCLGAGAILAVAAPRLPAAVSSPPSAPAGPATPSPPPPPPAAPKLALLKPPPAGASTFPWLPDYRRVLERFPLYHAQNWHEVRAGSETLGYFGTGDRAGALTQARALLAIAYLAGEPGYDARPSGIEAASLRTQALHSLRYLLRTHVTGDMDRASGGRWGKDRAAWQVIEPLVEASRLLRSQLTPGDIAALERVTAHEADRLLAENPASGPLSESHAAENAAAAECLTAAAGLLPNQANAARWEHQAQSFAMNALSAPQDPGSDAVVDGHPVREWVTTENLLPDFLMESAGAVNLDAELRTLASLTEAYYGAISQGRAVSEALTHHFEDAWGAVRRLWLGDDRFARPAGAAPGDARGDLSLFPVSALLEWVGSEPSVARLVERHCFQALESQQMARGDGSFFGGSPAEEAGVAADLTLAALIHRRQNALIAPADPEPLREQLAGAWTSSGAALAAARSRRCFASWSWRSVVQPAAPVGLFVPLDAPGLAAWAPDELTGSFALQGFAPTRTVHHQERTIEGGFTATGQIEEGAKGGLPGLNHFVAFAALPARRVAVLFDLAVAAQAVTVTRSEGLCLRLRLSGGDAHVLRSEEDPVPLGAPGPPAADRSLTSSWLDVDDHLGVAALYSQEPFTLRSLAATGGSLDPAPVVMVVTPSSSQPASYQAGQIVRDTAMLLVAADSATTARLAHDSTVLPTGNELVRAAVISGADGGRYLIAANFGLKETTVTLRPQGVSPPADLRLAPLDTLVLDLHG